MMWSTGSTLAVLAWARLAAAAAQPPVTLRGRVIDAKSGEPVAKALVSIRHPKLEAMSDASGRFVLAGVPPGEVEIAVMTVGYGLARRTVEASGTTEELEIRLSQEALRRAEVVAVIAPPFAPSDPAAPAAHALEGSELKNLANVLVDDPLRSVHALPGIAASDEFYASFAARGLGFSNAGLYVDGVLMSAPFHTIRNVNDAFSLTLLNGDVVESMSLLNGGAPARYGDRIGSVLDLKLRDGSREEFHGRASLGAAGLYATFEGPLGPARKTSWLASFRKSYLDYVLSRIDAARGTVLGYHDATAKLTHHPGPSHELSLGVLLGRSRWTSAEPDLRPQDSRTADAGTDLATLRWRWLPSSQAWLESLAFFSREAGRDRNLDATERFRATGRQWGLRTEATRILGYHQLAAGILVRGRSEDAATRDFDGESGSYRLTNSYDAGSVQQGAYVQNGWTRLRGRLTLTLGGRLERFQQTRERHVLPRASLNWGVSGNTRLLAAFGEYAQFPSFEQLLGRHGNPSARAERGRHYLLALERGLGGRARLRLEAYDQDLKGLLFTPERDWRLEDGRIEAPRFEAPLRNALAGHSRGLEIMVQRRAVNGLSGWVAYNYGHARWRDSASGLRFDGDFDQRHSLTVFGTLRLGHTLNLSTKYRYGSGFPVAGFYEAGPGGVFLSSERNRYRPESYSRWDVRVNKAFNFKRSRLMLYGEVTNLLDRTHTRYTGLDELDPKTQRVLLQNDTLFPFLPAVGVAVEF